MCLRVCVEGLFISSHHHPESQSPLLFFKELLPVFLYMGLFWTI